MPSHLRCLLFTLACSVLCFDQSLASTEKRDNFIDAVDAQLLAIATYTDVDPTLTKVLGQIDASEFKSDPILQVYAALLRPIPILKGVVWRLGELGAQSDAVYIAVMNALRGFKYRSYLYGPHIDALFDYVNLPDTSKERFHTVSDLQDYLTGPLAEALEKSLVSLKKLRTAEQAAIKHTINMQLFSGKGRFLSDANQKLIFVKPYVDYLANQIESILAVSYSFAAYNMDALLPFINRMAKDSLVNSNYTAVKNLLLSQADFNLRLQTPKEISQILKRPEFKGFLVTRGTKTKAHLDKALAYFKAANNSLLEAYRAAAPMAQLPQVFIFNHKRLEAVSDEVIAQLEERKKLFAGQKVLISQVTGARLQIDIKALFTAKPDLKAFYPTDFKNVPDHYVVKSDTKGRPDTFVWHYDYGLPTKWPDPTFGGFLPGATNKNIYEEVRTLVLTPSTSIFSMFLPIPSAVMLNGV